MKSQRERIHDLIEAIPSPAWERGYFGPEPNEVTAEVATQLRQLASELLAYSSRELAQIRARMPQLPRQEILDDDIEAGLHAALDAHARLRSCPAEEVEQAREALHVALEQVACAAIDPDHRKDAGLSRQQRLRTRELLAARQDDARERDRLQGELLRALGRADQAEQRATLAVAQRDQALRLVQAAARGDKAAGRTLADLAARLG